MQIQSNPISALNVLKSLKFLHHIGNWGRWDFRTEVEIRPFRHVQWKICRIAEISASWRKSGSSNM